MDQLTSRRIFAQYLAASPLIAALGTAACTEEKKEDENEAAEAARERTGTLGEPGTARKKEQAVPQAASNKNDRALAQFCHRIFSR